MSTFDEFLNKLRTAGGVPIVVKSWPVNWRQLATAVFGTLAATVYLGVADVINAVLGLPTQLLSGVTNFIEGQEASFAVLNGDFVRIAGEPGLIPELAESLTGVIWAAWLEVGEQNTWLAYLLAVGALLASLWIVNRGIAYVREEVL